MRTNWECRWAENVLDVELGRTDSAIGWVITPTATNTKKYKQKRQKFLVLVVLLLRYNSESKESLEAINMKAAFGLLGEILISVEEGDEGKVFAISRKWRKFFPLPLQKIEVEEMD